MRALVMTSTVALVLLAAAAAQAEPVTRQEVNIPFPFMVNGDELPAGSYSIRQDDDELAALLIEGSHAAVYVLTTPTGGRSPAPESSLVFAKDGNRYRLTQVWEDGAGMSVVSAG